MNPLQILQIMSVASSALKLAEEAATMYPQVRDALESSDRAQIDLVYADLVSKTGAMADKLRAIPDDPAG